MKSLLDSLPWSPETDQFWPGVTLYRNGLTVWITDRKEDGYVISDDATGRRWRGLDAATAECILIELKIDDPRKITLEGNRP